LRAFRTPELSSSPKSRRLSVTWRQIQDIGPPPRAGHAMALVTSDEGDHITLYGGEAANAFGDTWRLEDRS
jgi:hypothetical protein